jgi:hypothetical protein
VAVELLAAIVVDEVVVAAQEAGDHGTGSLRPVAETLAAEHRGQLHDARSLLRRGVLAAVESDRLVARHGLSMIAGAPPAETPAGPAMFGIRITGYAN